jgi:hypothetical protein
VVLRVWRGLLKVRSLNQIRHFTDSFSVLKAETETCMRLLGAEKVSDLGLKHVSSPFLQTNFKVSLLD